MPVKFSPSLNIIRDAKREYRYIPTTNSKKVVEGIIADFNAGLHSSVIIGSYGTGKSSMLWAFEQTLKGKEKFFDVSELVSKKSKIEFLRFVGEYQSIINSFAETLNVKKLSAANQEIFDTIHQHYEKLNADGLLVIYIDELGKFLEFGVKYQTEKELYFLQQLAEFVNAPDRRILLLTTLHQNFDAYATSLSDAQRQEWKKVKGRFREITFNEPVEQLLLLASNAIEQKSIDKSTQKKITEVNLLVRKNHIFKTDAEFIRQVGSKLFPLDFISGYTLTLALQHYGQNERSLFTFLESKEFKAASANKSFFNLVWLYDYLWVNFYSLLVTKYNPHFNAWSDIKSAIEKCEARVIRRTDDSINVLKVIGLLTAFSSKGASINKQFLIAYLQEACDIDKPAVLIDELMKQQIIIYRKFNDSFKLYEGTDIDIESALRKAEKKVEEVQDIAGSLNKHLEVLPFITAKKVTYETGTPRIFQFIISEQPQVKKPVEEIDGYINLVMNEKYPLKRLMEFSESTKEAIVFGYFTKADKIKETLFEIEKAYKVKADNDSDFVVKKEMDGVINHQKNLLRYYFLDSIYTEDVKWIYNGQVQKVKGNKSLNALLSRVCEQVYHQTPVFKNELVNRHKPSSVINNARKILFEKLVTGYHAGELIFDGKFPPEKTIYISLLRENKMHREEKKSFALSSPGKDSSFIHVWKACEEFLASSKYEKRRLTDLYDILYAKPFKLKTGLAELWIPIYLFVKRDDFALFGNDGYIPDINETTLNFFARNPQEYSIKAFSFEGVNLDLFNKYRELLQLPNEAKPTSESFIESIKPFLRFYRDLPEFSKQTRRLSKEAIGVREAIILSKDPEKTFFVDFPNALQTSLKQLNASKEALIDYAENLKRSIIEIRTSFDGLINRLERFICDEIVGARMEFNEYKNELQTRYQEVKAYMMVTNQREFYYRIYSKLDDKRSWLSSLTQGIIGKSLETIKDEDEYLLYDRFKTLIHQLDNLSEISSVKHDVQKEKVFKFEITAENVSEKRIVKIPKTKFEQLAKKESQVKTLLSKDDKQLNIAILTKLLHEELQK